MRPVFGYDPAASEEAATERREQQTHASWVLRQTGAQVLDLDKHVSWHTGHEVTRFSVYQRSDDWLVVIHARKRGKKYVAFSNGLTLSLALEMAGKQADKGQLTWLDHVPYKERMRRKGKR